MGWVGVLLQGRVPGRVDRPADGALGHPFAAPKTGGMVRCDNKKGVAVDEINQWGRSRRAGSGIMTCTICVHRESKGRPIMRPPARQLGCR